jgi:hypothetical protein
LVVERTVTLCEDKFTSESVLSHAAYQWAVVQKLVRKRNHIFLYFSKDSAMIIPRRAFEDPTAWDEFYAYCRRKTERPA